ncbi:hypothetical protein NVP1031O_039 [Vibrio phage 1.031.O._10N.261.46.F8]|nr:hypothetical protein NVP1031O_039 [Vibrio phage 1.031.O._10N.261.46.F8]
MTTSKQSAVSDVLKYVKIEQPCPIKSNVLIPADLRYVYYYQRIDDSTGILKTGIGLYLPAALELGATEVLSIRDEVHDWRFISPVMIDGKMSLATDGEQVAIHGLEPHVDDMNFLYGHHTFEGDLDIESLDVQVFTEERASIFYAQVHKILDEMGEIGDDVVLDGYQDDDDVGVLDKSQVISAYREHVKQIADEGKLTDEELEEKRVKAKYRRVVNHAMRVVNTGQDALLVQSLKEQYPDLDFEMLRALEFYNLITGDAAPLAWSEFLSPMTSDSPEWKYMMPRPASHYETFYVCTNLEIMSKYVRFDNPGAQVFIPRYGLVLNPATMKQEWQIVDFNVRNFNPGEKEPRYREWYPYGSIRNKRSELYSKYDELRPIVVYAGANVRNTFQNYYTDAARRGIMSADSRFDGRVVIKEGEINAMTFAMFNPDTVVVAIGTSKIPYEQLVKIQNNFTATCMMEVKFDDRIKSEIAMKTLRQERDDSVAGIGDHSYEAWNSTIPLSFQTADLDYEDMVAYVSQENPDWLRTVLSYTTHKSLTDPQWDTFIAGTRDRSRSMKVEQESLSIKTVDYRSHLLPDQVINRLATNHPDWVKLYTEVLRRGLSFEDTLLSDVDDRRIEELSHLIFESTTSAMVQHERDKQQQDAEALADGDKLTAISSDEDEAKHESNESTKPQIIRFVDSYEAESSFKLSKLFEEDDFRFITSVHSMAELGKDRYVELKNLESEWIDLSQKQMDRLTQKVSSTLGYNPAQQLIRELGFDLDATPDELPMAQETRHVALALGASGGKSTGLRAALIEYYGQICDRVEEFKLERIRSILQDMIESVGMHPLMQPSLIKLHALKGVDCNASERMSTYYKCLRDLPEDIQEGVKLQESTIVARMKKFIGMDGIKVDEMDLTLIQWLDQKVPGSKMAEFLRTRPNIYASVQDAAGRVDDGSEVHFDAIWKFYTSAYRRFPADVKKAFKGSNEEGVPRLHREIPPMIALENVFKTVDDLRDVAGRISYEIPTEVEEWLSEITDMYRKVTERTMVVACPSQIEVDKYYATLGNIMGIHNSFLKRLHADSFHGQTLGQDDEALVRCPVALVTHKRMDRPNRITKYLDCEGNLLNRKLVVVDESFSTRAPFLVNEKLLRDLNLHVMDGLLTRWCLTDEEIHTTAAEAQSSMENWLALGKLTPETRGIYQELLRLYYPTRKLGNKVEDIEGSFADMSSTEAFALVDSADVIVHGLASMHRDFLYNNKMSEYLDQEKDREEEAEDGEESESAQYDTSAVINFLKSMDDYWSAIQLQEDTGKVLTGNPSWDADAELTTTIYNWWYDQSKRAPDNSDRLIPLVNPLSRSFSDTSVVLLDATSYDTLTNEHAEGILENWKSDLLALSDSKDDDDATDKLADSQRSLLDSALMQNQIMTATYKRLCDHLTSGHLIGRSEFSNVNVRDEPDPWNKSKRLAPFIHNGGWLGYQNSSVNLSDLCWTVLKIPGPPIVLDTMQSVKLPLEKVSRDNTTTVRIGNDNVIVPHGLVNKETLGVLLTTLSGQYSQEFIQTILAKDGEVKSLIDDVAALYALIDQTEKLSLKVGNLCMPKDWESRSDTCPHYSGDESEYESWLSSEYGIELVSPPLGYTSVPIVTSQTQLEDGVEVEVPQVVGVVVVFNDGLRVRRREYWWTSFVTKTRSDTKMRQILRLLDDWDTPVCRLKLTTAMTALSLDHISNMVVDYLLLPDKEEVTVDGDDDGKVTLVPRALNLFIWRSVNHIYAGLLGEDSCEYFPPLKSAIDSVYDTSNHLVEMMEDAGTPLPVEMIKNMMAQAEASRKDIIRSMTTDSDFNTVIKSEIKPLPECIYNRVGRMVTKMYGETPDNERLKELYRNLDDYLMITHHNSTECKATSDHQHATGTMIVGMHMLPSTVINEQQIDLGMNFSNEGQSIALMVQELYRCRLRKGTIHNPKAVDLILVNCEDKLVKERVLAPNRGRTHHQHKSQNVIRRMSYDLGKSLEECAGLGGLVSDGAGFSGLSEKGTSTVSAIWLSLLEPEILDRIECGLPFSVVSTSNDVLLHSLAVSARPYLLEKFNMQLHASASPYTGSVFATRRSDRVITDNIEVFMADIYTAIQNTVKLGADITTILPHYDAVVSRIPALIQLAQS